MSLLNTPFSNPWVVLVDPKIKGVVYVLDVSGSAYRSTDSGETWIALLTAPGGGESAIALLATPDAIGTLAMDPFVAAVLLTDSQRSGDAGAT